MCCASLGTVALGCDERDDGTTPIAEATLPPLTLTDATPDLLITWIDERGEAHPGTALSEVPDSAKQHVRILTPTAGHGRLFYVADLSQKNADGSYVVRTMPSSAWEKLLEERRGAYRKKNAPPPVPKASASAKPPAAPSGGIAAIIYGAAWCGPCHQAAAYLKRRRVQVVEYDIEKEPDRAAEMQRKLRGAGLRGGSIPVIDVSGVILQGFSTRALDRAIEKAGKGPTAL